MGKALHAGLSLIPRAANPQNAAETPGDVPAFGRSNPDKSPPTYLMDGLAPLSRVGEVDFFWLLLPSLMRAITLSLIVSTRAIKYQCCFFDASQVFSTLPQSGSFTSKPPIAVVCDVNVPVKFKVSVSPSRFTEKLPSSISAPKSSTEYSILQSDEPYLTVKASKILFFTVNDIGHPCFVFPFQSPSNIIGMDVAVGVRVGVGFGVCVGVTVGVDVALDFGVNVGPIAWPDPHPETNKLKTISHAIMKPIEAVCICAFIVPPAAITGIPDND